nr:MAG TPA: hypothetical protein [Caudoviricetes sp.]
MSDGIRQGQGAGLVRFGHSGGHIVRGRRHPIPATTVRKRYNHGTERDNHPPEHHQREQPGGTGQPPLGLQWPQRRRHYADVGPCGSRAKAAGHRGLSAPSGEKRCDS